MSRFTTCTSPLKIASSTKAKAYYWTPAYQASLLYCSRIIMIMIMIFNEEAQLATVVWDNLENIALSSYCLISPYKIYYCYIINVLLLYVDDIYLQPNNEEKGNKFHGTMNSLHPRLKFKLKNPLHHQNAYPYLYLTSQLPSQ